MECKCETQVAETSYYVALNTVNCPSHKQANEEAFRLRVWVIEEGTFYNSYRDDTGDKPEDGLAFTASPFFNNEFICDLSKHLEKETAEVVPLGLQLFIDGGLGALSNMKFQKSTEIQQAELNERLTNAIKKTLDNQADLSNKDTYAMYVEKELKENNWLESFVIVPEKEAPKFDAAVIKAIKVYDDARLAQERAAMLDNLSATQRAQNEAKFALEQNDLLREQIKDLEAQTAKVAIRHQSELSALRAELQKAAGSYHCSQCTFLNPVSQKACGVCGHANGEPSEEKH